MIEVRQLSVYRGGREVLHNLEFTVAAGRCLAVVGPNGSGKSTLLAALAGDLPFEGHARIVGESVGTNQARRRAVMTQQTTVAFGFTVREVIAMGRVPWRKTSYASEDEAAIGEAVTAAGVAHLLDRSVQGLSGGELARVAFARLLAQRARVNLLDEPTAALDLKHQVGLLAEVRARVEAGDTVVLVVHDLTLASAVADEVLVLHSGRQAALGSPSAVLTPEILSEVYGVEVMVRAGIVVPAAWV